MDTTKPPEYGNRQVSEWLEMADRGRIALPVFQRSYVWKKPQMVADYLLAVFQNRPTGTFLLLESSNNPTFECRPLRGTAAPAMGRPEELLLDGQQRLTSLCQAFSGTSTVCYYIQVSSFNRDTIRVENVFTEAGARRQFGKEDLESPRTALENQLVPVHILRNLATKDAQHGQIWDWCKKASKDGRGSVDETKELEVAISALEKSLLYNRSLHFCRLNQSTSKRLAIQIFVQSNKSSVKVNEFDIAVAGALDEGEEDLRKRIDKFHQQSGTTGPFLRSAEDKEAHIAKIGEWMLFAGSLSLLDEAPKKQGYDKVIKRLFQDSTAENSAELDRLLKSIELALTRIEEYGAPTESTLPSLPALHVLAGLQRDIQSVTGALHEGAANRLISAYAWRAFFTDRYIARANDRLYADFKGLQKCLREIRAGRSFVQTDLPPIFNENEYKLPDANTLGSLEAPLPWIKRKSTKGRAISAIALAQSPRDFVTNKRLSATAVRDLEEKNQLDRHHVFPKACLKAHFRVDQIDHALNGVILGKSTNQTLSNKDPKDYLHSLLNQSNAPNEAQFRRNVESHFLPYDIITGSESIQVRYEKFIKERAKRIAAKVREYAKPD